MSDLFTIKFWMLTIEEVQPRSQAPTFALLEEMSALFAVDHYMTSNNVKETT